MSDMEWTAEERQALKEMEAKKQAKPIVEALSNAVNRSDNDLLDAVVRGITNDHRYLQSEAFSHLILACIRSWAKACDEQYFDQRNEWTVRTCRKLVNFLQTECNAYFPEFRE